MSNSRTQYGDSRTVRDAIAEGNKMTVNLQQQNYWLIELFAEPKVA